jgi:hypothetical protein
VQVQEPSCCAKVQIIVTVFVTSLAQSCVEHSPFEDGACNVCADTRAVPGLEWLVSFLRSREAGACVCVIDEAKLWGEHSDHR